MYASVSVCGNLYMCAGSLGGQRHKISLELELQVVSHQHEFWELNPRPLAGAYWLLTPPAHSLSFIPLCFLLCQPALGSFFLTLADPQCAGQPLQGIPYAHQAL